MVKSSHVNLGGKFMTFEKSNMKRMCSFCVSDWHMAATILPYIKERTENNEKVVSICEKGIEENIINLLERMKLEQSTKNKILQINWETRNWEKYEQFEYFMEGNYADNINVVVKGTKEYIEKINSYINNWIEKNNNRIKQENRNVKVISCYNISENIAQENILSNYNYVLNTTGEKEVREYFGIESISKLKIAK